ncbi:MAG: BBE domain-containing protein [Solirubrobacterales bacterium]|nr:BBE domain-containing protein [Solirubrobacterales bacterium]
MGGHRCDAPGPAALPGGYPNLLGPGDHERLGLAYGENADRLRELKRRYDPENVFASAICARRAGS